jgi:hypothetical protein
MDEQWEVFQSTAVGTLNLIWEDFAKQGRESAVFAPLSQFPNAAAWLASSMSLGQDSITRKLAAMLAGWIQHPLHLAFLSEMLEKERQLFKTDRLNANSVGEDIMFAATRWTESTIPEVKGAGIDILSRMIWDALDGTPWNTANWAAANLYAATGGKHEILVTFANASEKQLSGQTFLRKIADALRQNDQAILRKGFTPPSKLFVLSVKDSHYAAISALWNAAQAAEATLTQT